MGLGGHLTWTAVARELNKHNKNNGLKLFPCKQEGSRGYYVQSEIFFNNPYFLGDDDDPDKIFPLILNNPQTNYWTQEDGKMVTHKRDKHIIETISDFYEIEDPELKCELYFTDEETQKAEEKAKKLDSEFIIIEPHSKLSYTVNRRYPFEKWQDIVNKINKNIQVVQIGQKGNEVFEGVIDLTGQTSFREAAALTGAAKLFLSSEGGLVHAATAVDTKSIVILTGYQTPKMVEYPQNDYINIATHGPCGFKVKCPKCEEDAEKHNSDEVVKQIEKNLH